MMAVVGNSREPESRAKVAPASANSSQSSSPPATPISEEVDSLVTSPDRPSASKSPPAASSIEQHLMLSLSAEEDAELKRITYLDDASCSPSPSPGLGLEDGGSSGRHMAALAANGDDSTTAANAMAATINKQQQHQHSLPHAHHLDDDAVPGDKISASSSSPPLSSSSLSPAQTTMTSPTTTSNNQTTGNNQTGGDDEQTIELRFLVRRREAGALIGKRGTNIKRLRETFRSSMFSIPDTGNGPERVVCIATDEKSIDAILTDLTQLMQEKSPENDDQIELKLLIHSSHAGSIIGMGGQSIKKLRNDSKAAIKIYEMCCPLSNERVCAIKAKPAVVVTTIRLIQTILNTNPIKGTIKPYDALHFDLGAVEKYGGYLPDEALDLAAISHHHHHHHQHHGHQHHYDPMHYQRPALDASGFPKHYQASIWRSAPGSGDFHADGCELHTASFPDTCHLDQHHHQRSQARGQSETTSTNGKTGYGTDASHGANKGRESSADCREESRAAAAAGGQVAFGIARSARFQPYAGGVAGPPGGRRIAATAQLRHQHQPPPPPSPMVGSGGHLQRMGHSSYGPAPPSSLHHQHYHHQRQTGAPYPPHLSREPEDAAVAAFASMAERCRHASRPCLCMFLPMIPDALAAESAAAAAAAAASTTTATTPPPPPALVQLAQNFNYPRSSTYGLYKKK